MRSSPALSSTFENWGLKASIRNMPSIGPLNHAHGNPPVETRTRPLSTFVYNYSESFSTEVIKWLGDQDVKIERLSLKDILFGMFFREDDLCVNHILLLARQYLYSCRCMKTLPRIGIFIAKLI